MTVSLTEREIEILLEVCSQYTTELGEAEDTSEYTNYMLDTGLGSAMRKIGKGRKISSIYRNFKTVRDYPSFEEWQAQKRSSENGN